MAFDWKHTKKRIKDHLDQKFLMIIRNEDTFEETASYKLSLLNIYIILSSIFVAVSLILLILIIATPLKKLIPGYGDVRSQTEFITLQTKLEDLQNEIIAQETYISSIQRIMSGKPQTGSEMAKDNRIIPTTADPLPKIKEDSLLRKEYESSKSFNNPKDQVKMNTKIQGFQGLESSLSIPISMMEFESPLKGTIGASYGPEKEHYGIDIIAASNTPIKAILDGSVIQSDWSMENGHTIALQHDNNLISIYKHNSAILKRVGQRVKKLEAIAIIGNSGTLTDGPHLHFELWHNGRPVNPNQYITF